VKKQYKAVLQYLTYFDKLEITLRTINITDTYLLLNLKNIKVYQILSNITKVWTFFSMFFLNFGIAAAKQNKN